MPDRTPAARAALVEALILASARMHPNDLAPAIAATVARAGGTDIELVAADLAQQQLLPLLPGDHHNSYPIDDSPAGDAYRDRRLVHTHVPEGQRIWIPMADSATRVGVLGVTVHDSQPPERFLTAVAALAGSLIEAKGRIDDQLLESRRTRSTSLAAEMRWSMLPPLSFESDAVAVSGIFEPAYHIAGDTFDYAIHGTTLHLAILDAMGHELEASRMANLALASYRNSRRQRKSLIDIAHVMDEDVQACFERSRYVTGQLATLDMGLGSFQLLNMGHPQPLHIRNRKVIAELASKPTLPAGWGGSSTAEVFETTLQPGDSIVMYSDGITEAPDHTDTPFGLERLIDILDRHLAAGTPTDELTRQVVDEVMRHQQRHARDDATLLVTTYQP